MDVRMEYVGVDVGIAAINGTLVFFVFETLDS